MNKIPVLEPLLFFFKFKTNWETSTYVVYIFMFWYKVEKLLNSEKYWDGGHAK